jgi:hypothetical protein
LAKFKVFDRCSATIVLDALKADRFHNGDVLSCQALVRAYDEDVRSLMLASADTAELILSKHLLSDSRTGIYLPASLTPADCRALLDQQPYLPQRPGPVDGGVGCGHERGEQSRVPVLAAPGELPHGFERVEARREGVRQAGRVPEAGHDAADLFHTFHPSIRVAYRVKADPGIALRVQPSSGHAAWPWVRPMLSAIWRRCSFGNR